MLTGECCVVTDDPFHITREEMVQRQDPNASLELCKARVAALCPLLERGERTHEECERFVVQWIDAERDTFGRPIADDDPEYMALFARLRDAANVFEDGPKINGHDPSGFNGPEPPPHGEPVEPPRPYVSLRSTTTSDWGTRDIVRREWVLEDAIPANQAMILNGHGGEGKTLLMLQICVAIVLYLHEVLGMLVQRGGPVIFYSGEEDREEVDRRLADILRNTGHHPSELTGKLHVVSRVGEDAILSTAKDDVVTPTKLYRELEEMSGDLRAVLVVLDSVTHVFACNQINIAHAVQNIGLMKRLSRAHRAATIGIQHVSLEGVKSGMGTFGTMGWHNFSRARAYLQSLSSDKDRADDGLRKLSFMKQNYGPRGKPIELQWSDGRFVVPGVASFERKAAENRIDDLFLLLLDRANHRKMPVSPHRSNAFAPTEFLKEPEAINEGITKAQFEDSMKRLIDSDQVRPIDEGPPSRRRTHLVRPLATGSGEPVRRYEPQPTGTICEWCGEPGTDDKPVHRIVPGGGYKSECLHSGDCENAWPAWRGTHKGTVVELKPKGE
jgi:RecA-family ATPase